jgi:hypothetical protein
MAVSGALVNNYQTRGCSDRDVRSRLSKVSVGVR